MIYSILHICKQCFPIEKRLFAGLFFLMCLYVLVSCRSNDPLPAKRTTETVSTPGVNTSTGVDTTSNDTTAIPAEFTTLVNLTAENIPADTTQAYASTSGTFTLYSLATHRIVPNSKINTTQWDIAFLGTTIIFNGGTSGPGNGGVVLQLTSYNDITEAPTSGYAQDNSNAVSKYALKTGSGNGWYTYNDVTHIIYPIPGRTLIIRCANGKYAKLAISSYYKNSPSNPTENDKSRFYTFRYAYQGDGSTALK